MESSAVLPPFQAATATPAEPRCGRRRVEAPRAVLAQTHQESRHGAPELPAALDAPRTIFKGDQLPQVNYYADGPAEGAPLVLVHSINAAPSAFEMKPLFDHYRSTRRVYALELPGFGFSDRGDRVYSPQLYADVMLAFLTEVVRAPADFICFSLSCEFAARAALRHPDAFGRLVLLSPTGFSKRRLPSADTGKRLHRFFTLPAFGEGLYRLLTVRSSIRYFLRRSFVAEPPQELIDYAYATSHQPGAHHAPFYFLAGQLFTPDAVDTLYRRLPQQVLVIHDRDANVSFDLLPALAASQPNWHVTRVAPSLGMPQWEEPERTIAAIDAFWKGHPASQ